MIAWLKNEPVAIVALVLVVVMVVQMVLRGEVVTTDFINTVLILFGAGVARSQVTPTHRK